MRGLRSDETGSSPAERGGNDFSQENEIALAPSLLFKLGQVGLLLVCERISGSGIFDCVDFQMIA